MGVVNCPHFTDIKTRARNNCISSYFPSCWKGTWLQWLIPFLLPIWSPLAQNTWHKAISLSDIPANTESCHTVPQQQRRPVLLVPLYTACLYVSPVVLQDLVLSIFGGLGPVHLWDHLKSSSHLAAGWQPCFVSVFIKELKLTLHRS